MGYWQETCKEMLDKQKQTIVHIGDDTRLLYVLPPPGGENQYILVMKLLLQLDILGGCYLMFSCLLVWFGCLKIIY